MLEVIIRGHVQLFQEVVLPIGVAFEIFSPAQRLSKHKEHLLQVCDRNESSSILIELDPAFSEIFNVLLLYKIVGFVIRLLKSFDDDSDEYVEEEKGYEQEVCHEERHTSP